MDFQKLADSIGAFTAVISIEKLDNGKYGKIRIVTGNKAYISSIEQPYNGMEMLTRKFIPNSEYTDYLTRDLNFEDACYSAAILKECRHSYVHPDRIDAWFNMSFIPVNYEEGNICYCLYVMEVNIVPDRKKLSGVSGDIASSVLEACILLRSATDFKAAMNETIKAIADICGSEHCCILLMDTEKRSCSVLCENIAEGSALLPMETYVNDEFYNIAESWEGTICGSNCLIAKNEQDMEVVRERNPVWHESLKMAGAKTIVLFPLKSGNDLLGYMWAINFDPSNANKIKEALELTTFILGNEIGNHLLLSRLKILGSRDMLTGVMNRNEMNNFVDALSNDTVSKNRAVGVIFADLNGLKKINDSDGHSAGDDLLKKAAEALKAVFDVNYIFRAGGDEFSMIITDITENELNSMVSSLKKIIKTYSNLSFALGAAYESDIRNVRNALRIADERMYDDKRNYYKLYPERK